MTLTQAGQEASATRVSSRTGWGFFRMIKLVYETGKSLLIT